MIASNMVDQIFHGNKHVSTLRAGVGVVVQMRSKHSVMALLHVYAECLLGGTDLLTQKTSMDYFDTMIHLYMYY